MLAVRYVQPGELELFAYQPQPPGPGEVQLEPAFTGICGTDLHIIAGDMSPRVGPGRVIGHETAAVVTAVGDDVADWRPGDAVGVLPIRACGTCPACADGLGHICHRLNFLGVDSAGALQQRWNVPQDTLVRLPAGLALQDAALLEPTAVAVHDVRRAGVRAGERVLVVGGGPVGLLIAIVARRVGADLRLVEPDGYRRSVAQGLGLAVLDPGEDRVSDVVQEWTAAAGADVAFEVSGAAAGMDTAVRSLRSRGRLCLVAIHARPREVDLQQIFLRELNLLGARLYVRDDFDRAAELLADGTVPAGKLVSAIRPLAGAVDAFRELQGGGVMKILLDCRAEPGAA